VADVHYALVVLVGIVVVPIGVLGGLVFVAALAGEWLGYRLVDLSGVPLLGWLADIDFFQSLYGEGASSFENYLAFIVGFIVVAGSFSLMKATWAWASLQEQAPPVLGESLSASISTARTPDMVRHVALSPEGWGATFYLERDSDGIAQWSYDLDAEAGELDVIANPGLIQRLDQAIYRMELRLGLPARAGMPWVTEDPPKPLPGWPWQDTADSPKPID
jgi:hypothetical protein